MDPPMVEYVHLDTMSLNIYNLAFSKSHDIIIIADCNHRIFDVNPAAIRNFGHSKAEFLQMDLGQLLYEEDEVSKFSSEICIRENIIHWEFEFKNKDGEPFPVLINADMIDEEKGIFMVVAQNIQQMQHKIKNRRTKSEMMLLGKLGQTISHEIRNPLNNIFLGLNQFQSFLADDKREE